MIWNGLEINRPPLDIIHFKSWSQLFKIGAHAQSTFAITLRVFLKRLIVYRVHSIITVALEYVQRATIAKRGKDLFHITSENNGKDLSHTAAVPDPGTGSAELFSVRVTFYFF